MSECCLPLSMSTIVSQGPVSKYRLRVYTRATLYPNLVGSLKDVSCFLRCRSNCLRYAVLTPRFLILRSLQVAARICSCPSGGKHHPGVGIPSVRIPKGTSDNKAPASLNDMLQNARDPTQIIIIRRLNWSSISYQVSNS